MGRPARLRPLLRGPRGDARGGRGRRPRQQGHHLVGHPVARPRRRRHAPSWGGGRHACVDVSRCTRESPDLYSYRRDGDLRAGRQAGLIRMAVCVRPPRRARRQPRRRTPPHRRRLRATAGRDADEVTLVVVTKFFPASDVRLLADLGVTDVGENRHQEAEEKAAECADLRVRWHFVGGLQSNKAAAVAAYADVVESVDRAKLVAPSEPRRARAFPRRRLPAPGQPRPAGRSKPVAGPAPTPTTSTRWPPQWTRPGCCGCVA